MTVVSKDPFSHLSISHGPTNNGKDEKYAGCLESEGGWAILTGLTPRFLPESDNLLPLAPTVLDLCTVSAGGGDRF